MHSLYSILFDENEMESSIPSHFNENEHISARVCMYVHGCTCVCNHVHISVHVWYMCLCVHVCGGVRTCAHCWCGQWLARVPFPRCGALLPVVVGPPALGPSCSAL